LTALRTEPVGTIIDVGSWRGQRLAETLLDPRIQYASRVECIGIERDSELFPVTERAFHQRVAAALALRSAPAGQNGIRLVKEWDVTEPRIGDGAILVQLSHGIYNDGLIGLTARIVEDLRRRMPERPIVLVVRASGLLSFLTVTDVFLSLRPAFATRSQCWRDHQLPKLVGMLRLRRVRGFVPSPGIQEPDDIIDKVIPWSHDNAGVAKVVLKIWHGGVIEAIVGAYTERLTRPGLEPDIPDEDVQFWFEAGLADGLRLAPGARRGREPGVQDVNRDLDLERLIHQPEEHRTPAGVVLHGWRA